MPQRSEFLQKGLAWLIWGPSIFCMPSQDAIQIFTTACSIMYKRSWQTKSLFKYRRISLLKGSSEVVPRELCSPLQARAQQVSEADPVGLPYLAPLLQFLSWQAAGGSSSVSAVSVLLPVLFCLLAASQNEKHGTLYLACWFADDLLLHAWQSAADLALTGLPDGLLSASGWYLTMQHSVSWSRGACTTM